MAFLLPPWLDQLLINPCCPRCKKSNNERKLCISCRRSLALEVEGSNGQCPLPWWALGSYEGGLRQQLLQLRKQRNHQLVKALARMLLQLIPDLGVPLLITAIPEKRAGGFSMPWQMAEVIAQEGGHQLVKALARNRACLGQHHLNRKQRLSNLQGVFRCVEPAKEKLQPLLLVDDILTTGATALAAMEALEQAGHGLLGIACLARTPAAKNKGQVG